MAQGDESVELVARKEPDLQSIELAERSIPVEDATGFGTDTEAGRKEKWTSIFKAGAEDPDWCHLNGGIIHPSSRRYTIWWGVSAVLVTYWIFATWLIWGFIPRPSIGLVLAQTVVSCFFALDTGIRFRVAYLDTKTLMLVQDPSKIARRYLTRGFVFDIVSIIPYDLLFYIFTSRPAHGWVLETLHSLALLRMFRLPDIFRFFGRIGKEGKSVYWTTRFVKLAMIVFLSAHIAACVLWFISRQEVQHSGDPSGCIFGAYTEDWQDFPLYKKWISAFYWSVLTVSSIGYGDFLPVTQIERIVVCFYEIFGLGVLSYALGCLEVMLVREVDRTGRYHDKVRALNDYASRKQLPASLKRSLKQHLVLEMAVDKVKPDVLNEFPHHLRAKILRSQYLRLVARTYLFQATSPQFLDQVVGEMTLEIQLPNAAVVTSGDIAESLYVVVSGSLTREKGYATADQPQDSLPTSAQLRAGAVIGKVAVMYDKPQLFTVRALEVCELLKLEKSTLTRILKAYPEDNKQMLANLKERIDAQVARKSARDGAQELALQLSTVLEQQDTEVTRRVCNTATRGNVQRLAELCVTRGACNGADYDGRTPLHFAAAAGFEGCVDLLIKSGASLNAKDNLGRTPLLEAILNGHANCVAPLKAAGATLDLQDAGHTLCHVAASGAVDRLSNLLECGADPNAVNYDGRTALHMAVVKDREEVVRLLLHAGADPDYVAEGTPSPRTEAQAAGRTKFMQLFN